MTNDCRKSDTVVVPEKSSNKPVKEGAEKMEGRRVPKENKRQQNMLRTQRRESVLSELQLIHQKELVSLSEGGAVCTNIARTDLCGGCRVTGIPTATIVCRLVFLPCKMQKNPSL